MFERLRPSGFASFDLWAAARFDPRSLFGGGNSSAPAAPTPQPPPEMPDPLSPENLEARRRAMAAATMGGRASTMLTGPGRQAASGSATGPKYAPAGAAASGTIAGAASPYGAKTLGGS